jgi:Stage II sporulation protein E (SpoIIE)
LLALFLTFAHDRIASTRLFDWHADTEPYGVFVLICCLGYAATRRVLANERLLFSLSEEMRAATRIQSSILPRTKPEMGSFRLAMTAVAGDFYDFLMIRPSCLGIVVADVTGHGVPAALVASMVKVAVSAHIDWSRAWQGHHIGIVLAFNCAVDVVDNAGLFPVTVHARVGLQVTKRSQLVLALKFDHAPRLPTRELPRGTKTGTRHYFARSLAAQIRVVNLLHDIMGTLFAYREAVLQR